MQRIVSNCCSGGVYAPTKDWARCLICLEYCDIVDFPKAQQDLDIVKSWYDKKWISYREFLRLTDLLF